MTILDIFTDVSSLGKGRSIGHEKWDTQDLRERPC